MVFFINDYQQHQQLPYKRSTQYVTVCALQAGRRLDNYLLNLLRGLPRSHIYRIIQSGEVRINGGRSKPGRRIIDGDSIRIPPVIIKDRATTAIPDPELIQRILFEDDNLLVIDKPAGMAVHGGSGLSTGLIETLRASCPADDYLELAHRLDRHTSGCLIVARHPEMLRKLHQAFREGLINKSYLALVSGHWPTHLQQIDAPVLRHATPQQGRRVAVSARGRRSVTDIKCLSRFTEPTELSLIEASPRSGRMHQIRIHCQYAGFPICGDAGYGSRNIQNHLRALGLRRMFLHASAICIDLPGVNLDVCCPTPPDLTALVDRLIQDNLQTKV